MSISRFASVMTGCLFSTLVFAQYGGSGNTRQQQQRAEQQREAERERQAEQQRERAERQREAERERQAEQQRERAERQREAEKERQAEQQRQRAEQQREAEKQSQQQRAEHQRDAERARQAEQLRERADRQRESKKDNQAEVQRQRAEQQHEAEKQRQQQQQRVVQEREAEKERQQQQQRLTQAREAEKERQAEKQRVAQERDAEKERQQQRVTQAREAEKERQAEQQRVAQERDAERERQKQRVAQEREAEKERQQQRVTQAREAEKERQAEKLRVAQERDAERERQSVMQRQQLQQQSPGKTQLQQPQPQQQQQQNPLARSGLPPGVVGSIADPNRVGIQASGGLATRPQLYTPPPTSSRPQVGYGDNAYRPTGTPQRDTSSEGAQSAANRLMPQALQSGQASTDANRQPGKVFAGYQTPVVTMSPSQPTCPPGSSPARHANGTYVAIPPASICIKNEQHTAGLDDLRSRNGDNNSAAERVLPSSGATTGTRMSSSSGEDDPRTPPGTNQKTPKKPEWGPVQMEALAICRQSTKSGKWECNGSLDNQIIVDEPTLESALARQHCAGGTWAAGGPVLKGVQWEAYRCGRALGAGDYDVAKRYSLITARRSYMCPKYQPGDGRCTTIYDGQDKR